MSKTYEGQRRELANIRAWITDQIAGETDRETRDYLFEARQAIGFALLHLDRVDYRTIEYSPDLEDQLESPPASGGDGGLMTND
jgi:hypothetical protein